MNLDAPARERLEVFLELTDPDAVSPGLVDSLTVAAFGVVVPEGNEHLPRDVDVSVHVRDRYQNHATVWSRDFRQHHGDATRLVEHMRGSLALSTLGEFLAAHDIETDSISPGPRRAYLGIGSNLGDRLANLQGAVDGLAATAGVTVAAVSPVYETDPVGGPAQPEYLNAVVAVDTELSARELLQIGQALEGAAHRVREERWGPRTLDVDVLLVDDEEVHDPDLEVPHPRMWERAFVLAPLGDLDPEIGALTRPEGGWSGVRPTDLSLSLP